MFYQDTARRRTAVVVQVAAPPLVQRGADDEASGRQGEHVDRLHHRAG